MASDRQLLIEIEADDKGSVKTVRQNAAAIEGLEKSANRASKGVVQYNKQQDRMRLSSRRANMVLIDTGRIVQDLPYGFRGVANNIDPFVNSLQRAKAATGSYKTVLTGLISSLASPAGIGVAISALSSILLVYGPKIADWFGIFDEGKKKVDDSIKSIKDLKKELSFFKSRRPVAFDLLDQAFPDAEGLKKKKLELQVIRQLQGQALSQLTKLQGAGNVKGQLNELNALIDRFERAGKNAESILKNKGLIGPNSSYEQTLADLKQRRANVQERINVLLKDEKRYKGEIYSQQVEINQAQSFKNSELGRTLQLQANLQDQYEKDEAYQKKRLESLKKANIELKKGYDQLLENERKKAQSAQPIAGGELDTSLPGQNRLNFNEYAGASGRLRQQLARYNDELARSYDLTEKVGKQMLFQYKASEQLSRGVERLAEQSFVALGESLGQLAAGNVDGSIFDKYKLIFADFMSFFGKSLIALGIGSKSFRKFLSNPIVAVAAGTALVAAAAAIRSTTQDKVNRITGGGSTGVIGYRGLDFGSSLATGTGQGSSTRGPAAAALVAPSNGSRTIIIKDGLGNMVAKGQEEIDRNGGSRYLRGGARG